MKTIFTVEANGEVSQGFIDTNKWSIDITNHQEAYDDLHTNEKLASEEMEDGSYDVVIEIDEIEIILYSCEPTTFTIAGQKHEISPTSGIRMPIYELEDLLAAIGDGAGYLWAEVSC